MNSAEAEILRERFWRDGRLSDPAARFIPLAGGVSSDIYLVEDGAERFVVKRALPWQRVRAGWRADVSCNAVEHAHFERVGRFAPRTVQRVFFANAASGYFAMAYLGAGFSNWKRQLLDGTFAVETARTAGLPTMRVRGISASCKTANAPHCLPALAAATHPRRAGDWRTWVLP